MNKKFLKFQNSLITKIFKIHSFLMDFFQKNSEFLYENNVKFFSQNQEMFNMIEISIKMI